MNLIDIMSNKRRQSKGVHAKQSHLYDARTGKLINNDRSQNSGYPAWEN